MKETSACGRNARGGARRAWREENKPTGGGAIKEDFTGEGSLEMKLKDEADLAGGMGKRETRKRQELSGSTKGRSHLLKGC